MQVDVVAAGIGGDLFSSAGAAATQPSIRRRDSSSSLRGSAGAPASSNSGTTIPPLTPDTPDVDVAAVRCSRVVEADREADLAVSSTFSSTLARPSPSGSAGGTSLAPLRSARKFVRLPFAAAKPPTVPTPNSSATPAATADFLCIPIATSLDGSDRSERRRPYLRASGPFGLLFRLREPAVSWAPISGHVNSAS